MGKHPVLRLPVPRTAGGRAGLAALIARPAEALIGVDFDGTLAAIVPDPAAARADPAATAALGRLSGLVGTVAIITGRPAAQAADLAGLAAAGPRVIVLGHYGSERWENGALTSQPPPPGLAIAQAELPLVLARAGTDAGTYVEDKGYAVAVHTRRTARPLAELDLLRQPLADLAGRTGLLVQPGRLVIELRPPGSDKGRALRDLVAQRSAASVLFCGDDLGDLPAFEALRELRAEGIPGLAVCSGSAEEPALAAAADLVVAGPGGVTALLSGLAAVLSGQQGAASGPGLADDQGPVSGR